MKKVILIVTGVLLIIFSIYGIYKTATKPKVEADLSKIEESVDTLKSEIDIFKKLQEGNATPEEIVGFQEELEKKYSKPEAAIDYLMSGAMLKDPTVYRDSFIYETFQKDIFGQSEPDKVKLAEEIMDRLTRSGSLEKVDYKDVKWTTEKKTVRILTDFYYTDLSEPIRVSILVKQKEAEKKHGEDGAGDEHTASTNFYYVYTSAWEMIHSIEKGALNNE